MDKKSLRKQLRVARREHVEALPDAMRGLVFRHPPAPLLGLIDEDAVIGLYHATHGEAPTTAYAGFFQERDHRIALPRVTELDKPMTFHIHTDPYGATDLVEGPMKLLQPEAEAEQVTPDVLFMPLVGFTERGERIGQGGGFYDRWLADHPSTLAIGMAWDCQRIEAFPIEVHDRTLTAVVTPTRLYGPF